MSELDNDDVARIIAAVKLTQQRTNSSDSKLGSDDDLDSKFNAFMTASSVFNVGDKVRWKRGLKNKKYPKEGQICMVVQVLEKDVIQENRDSGSPYYREPLNLVLALLDDDNDLVLFHYDKRRFEIVEKAKTNEGV